MDKKILQQHLAEALAERSGLTKRRAESFVRSFFELTEEGLLADGIVKVKGFGTTKIVSVNDRESVNVNTGERFQIEGHDKISFVPDTFFRDLVNRPFAQFSTVILDDSLDESELAAAETPAPVVQEEASIKPERPTLITPEPEPVAPAEETAAPAEETVEPVKEPVEPAEPIAAAEPQPLVIEPQPAEPQPASAEPSTFCSEGIGARQSENPQPSTFNPSSPIIINNTMPAPQHNWWKSAFVVLTTLILMVLSYIAGYYRILGPNVPAAEQAPAAPTVVATPAPQTTAPATTTEPAQPTADDARATDQQSADAERIAAERRAAADKKAQEKAAAAQKAAAERRAAEERAAKERTARERAEAEKKAQEKAAAAQKAERAAAQRYEQLGGEYLITGVLETHEMQPGENLYKLAKNVYGDKDLARYIIFHNHIANPDLVTIGQKIQLPKLTKK